MKAPFRFLLICLISALLVIGLCPVFANAYGVSTPDSIKIVSSSNFDHGDAYVQANSIDHVDITAKVLDQRGHPMSGVKVDFTIGTAKDNTFIGGGFIWTPAHGSLSAGPSYTRDMLNVVTGNDGTVTIPFGWVDQYYGGNSSWVWAYVSDNHSLKDKIKIEFTYPSKIKVSAEPVSIIANSLDISTVTAKVFDNKGNPFNSARVDFTIGTAKDNTFIGGGFIWTPANGSLTPGPSYTRDMLNVVTGNDGISSVVFGFVDNYYKGNCSYVWAYLTDYPSRNGKVKICFQPPNPTVITTFTPQKADHGNTFRFTLSGSRIPEDSRVILKQNGNEIDPMVVWWDTSSLLIGAFSIPPDAQTGKWDIILQKRDGINWVTVATIPKGFVVT